MATEDQFLSSLDQIKALHDEAFRAVDQAVRCEENETPIEAMRLYKKCIQIIDSALATPVGLPDDVQSVQDKWTEACKMIHKLKRARAEVIQRVGILSEKYGPVQDVEPVTTHRPSVVEYDALKFSVADENGRPRTYTELAQALRDLQCNREITSTNNSLELIFNCEGVKLYHIKSNGMVTTTSEDSVMRILRLEKDQRRRLNTTFFIQIIKSSHAVLLGSQAQFQPSTSYYCEPSTRDNFDGQNESSWIYPLIPGVSPCFRTEYGAFIFPDLESLDEGSSFGIIVPKEDKIDEIVLEILESILHGVVTQLKDGEKRKPRDISVKVSEDIVRSANFISKNLVKGAEKTGQFISYSTPFIMSKMSAAPDDAPPVSSKVQNTVEVAKSVTGVAAGVTGYIAGKVGSATMALGRFLAPHIQKHGSTLLSKGLGMNETEAQEKMQGVLTIAAGAIEGFSTVYAGLEDSAKVLGNSLSNNSVKIIQHKYGPSAGNLAFGTFDTVGNMINVSQNVNYITPKGLAKRTAKNAGKALVEDFKPTLRDEKQFVPAGTLYPDLNGLETQVNRID